MTPNQTHVDVLVVGAGGLVSAARHGASVLVVERRSTPSNLPRGTVLSIRSMEIFHSWGPAGRVRARGVDVPITASVSRTLADEQPLTVPLYSSPAVDPAPLSPTTAACVPQDRLEPVLAEHVVSRGGEVRTGTRLTDLTVTPDDMQATLTHDATGRTDRVRARYVVGADGARSAVRSALGIGVRTLGQLGEYLQVTFRADLDTVVGQRRHALYFLDHPEAGGVLLPAAGGRWVHSWEWHPERGESLQDWTPDRIPSVSGPPPACPTWRLRSWR